MTRILIVEDEPTVRNILCTILESSYECVAVRSAEEGLALLAESPFDVVITDVRLPGMGGGDFLKAVVESHQRLPVIVMTGADSDEAGFLAERAFGYLLKPFRFEEVEEMVGRALGNRE